MSFYKCFPTQILPAICAEKNPLSGPAMMGELEVQAKGMASKLDVCCETSAVLCMLSVT